MELPYYQAQGTQSLLRTTRRRWSLCCCFLFPLSQIPADLSSTSSTRRLTVHLHLPSPTSTGRASLSHGRTAGGKMVVEFVGAFNEPTERMNLLSTSSSPLLFMTLKLSIPLQSFPFSPDGRSPLSRALSVASLQAKRLKAIMMAAAELAALRLRDIPSGNHQRGINGDRENRVFQLLDKNGDGRISLEELTEVVEELGAEREDADELMQLLDTNSDGF